MAVYPARHIRVWPAIDSAAPGQAQRGHDSGKRKDPRRQRKHASCAKRRVRYTADSGTRQRCQIADAADCGVRPCQQARLNRRLPQCAVMDVVNCVAGVAADLPRRSDQLAAASTSATIKAAICSGVACNTSAASHGSARRLSIEPKFEILSAARTRGKSADKRALQPMRSANIGGRFNDTACQCSPASALAQSPPVVLPIKRWRPSSATTRPWR